MNLFAKQKRRPETANKCMDIREGGDGMNWEIRVDAHTHTYTHTMYKTGN